MSEKVIKIKRGINIELIGAAEKVLTKASESTSYALVPDDFIGVTPKLLVKEGDVVKIGTPVFFDKEHPEVIFSSPASGTVSAIVRGDKRKILSVVITPDGTNSAENFGSAENASGDEVRALLQKAGYWPMIIRRPFGIIAGACETPRDIFISGLDTAPLGVDTGFILQDELENLNAGIAALKKLTPGNVYLTIASDTTAGTLTKTSGAVINRIEGPHPAGNVGTQIEAIRPIAKGDIVWTVDIQHVAMIGRLIKTGNADFSKTVAVAGSCIKKPHYFRTTSGATLNSIMGGQLDASQSKTGHIRTINGNPLSGSKVDQNGYVGFYNNLISAIPEGDYFEFAGWMMPRLKKFSVSKSYFSWLTPRKKYNLDTNINGGERAFVSNGIYERVMPMDIYPVYLLKAVMAADIDKMEQLGIYEVIEEDLALCEFICPSKIEWQATLRDGMTKMIKEM